MELITLTGSNNRTEEREQDLEGPGLFPEYEDGSKEANMFDYQRCYIFDKPTVFLSARVHPGEV